MTRIEVYKHGTNSCYAHGCREYECRLAHRDYERERIRHLAYERGGREAPAPVQQNYLRQVVQRVTSPQISVDDLAARSGISRWTLLRLIKGGRVHDRHARQIQTALLEFLPSEGGEATQTNS